MTGLCTRCQKPLGKVAAQTYKGLMHYDCYRAEAIQHDTKLRADRDRLLAACKAALEWMERCHEYPPDELEIEVREAIRLADEE